MTPPIEPVHPQAHLRRSPLVQYTEVAGEPVLCHTDDRSVHAFSAATVVLWAGFDGRPLTEVAGVDPSAAAWRDLVEVVRRFKATGLIDDVPPGEAADVPDLAAPVPVVTSLRVVGTWADDPAPTGDGPRVLALHSREDDTAVIEVTTAEGGLRTVDGRAVAGVMLPPSLRVSVGAGPAVVAFAAWVRAIVDVDELRRPGVVDALAGLAESVPVVPA